MATDPKALDALAAEEALAKALHDEFCLIDGCPGWQADEVHERVYRLRARRIAEKASLVPTATLDALRKAAPDADQLAVIAKALRIGEVSWDGDSWFAKDAGWDYDEAEAAFDAAFTVVKECLASLPAEQPETPETER